MASTATIMAKKKANEQEQGEGHCTYVSVKIDDELPPIIRMAAAKCRVSIQEFMSDVLNSAAAEALGVEPIRRRPPPPRGK